MPRQLRLPNAATAPEHVDGRIHEVASDIAYVRLGIVNVVMCGYAHAGPERWILVDAGVHGFAGALLRAATDRFGSEQRGRAARPFSILLTHGHFDHVGAIDRLLQAWDVPVYAHPLERPYLSGARSYPPPDPWAGGLMSMMSPMFPRGPIDISSHLQSLPADGSVPGMPGWRWIHTPGHTPGHISLWRERDRTLIAGDALVTCAQELVYEAVVRDPEIHGPPQYFTQDWTAAAQSVAMLADLEPELLISGHGKALHGPLMRSALHRLTEQFDKIAVPSSRK